MKKNKKLFAILTLVAFMMTLMPVMAFAAEPANGNLLAPHTTTPVEIAANGDIALKADSGTPTKFFPVTATPSSDPVSYQIAGGVAGVAKITAAGLYVIAVTGNDDNTTGIVSGIEASKVVEVTASHITESEANAYLTAKTGISAYLSAKNTTTLLAICTGYENLSAGAKTIVDSKIDSTWTGAEVAALKTALDNKAGVQAANAANPAALTETQLTAALKADTAALRAAIVDDSTVLGYLDTAKATKVVLDAWDAYLKDAKNDDKLYSFQAKNTSDAGFANVINDRKAGSDVVMGRVASARNAAVASVILSDAGIIASGGSGSNPINPIVPENGTASVSASMISTEEENVSVDAARDANSGSGFVEAKKVVFNLTMKNSSDKQVTPVPAQKVYVWAEESGKTNQPTDAFIIKNYTPMSKFAGSLNGNIYEMSIGAYATAFEANFLRAGSFTLKASFSEPVAADGKLASIQTLKTMSNKSTITVTSAAADTRGWAIRAGYKIDGSNAAYQIISGDANNLIYDGNTSRSSIEIKANAVDVTKVALTLFSQQGLTVGNYPITLDTNSANVELSQKRITTGADGVAYFNVAGLREGTYKIYVTVGDYESTITVKVGSTDASDISLVKFPSAPIATDTDVKDYKNIFRMVLTDANGNVVAEQGSTSGARHATACIDSVSNNTVDMTIEDSKYVSVVSAPEANKVKSTDLYISLVTDSTGKSKDYYTLNLLNGKKFEAEGSYEIKVVLDNGKSATITFEVKKFDKAVGLAIEYPTTAVELNATTDVPDIYFTDANGVTKKANNRVTVAATGYAVANVTSGGDEAGVITVKNDEKYLGQTITVSAVAEKENLVATTELTVTDSAQSIKLDTNRGQVNANNRIGFKLVNSNGQAVALGNDTVIDDVTCIVTNVENPDAKVSFSVAGTTRADLQANGTGVINLTSNKETTATVQIMIKATKKTISDNRQDNNTGLSTTYYTGTETFTFGAEADKSVVMTIGSTEIVANNVPTTIDVAPFIQDNRTWVPFRALVEAFGAEVEYNAENNTVTTKLAGKTVVMTVGSNVMTVNDEAVTMDVAPFIVDDRVVVPVRFVGEAFGFTVEAIADATTGATASVVFYQK